MIERFAAALCRFERNRQLLLGLLLADNSFSQRGRSFSSKEFSSSARAALTRRSGSSLPAIHSEFSSLMEPVLLDRD
jgi:hypothetical protein